MERAAIEADIAEHLVAGRHDAVVTSILRHYGGELYSYLVSIVRDVGVADDAFSQLTEDLWRAVASFRRESSCRTWCYRIAWHAAMRALQDPYRRRAVPGHTGQWSELVAEIRSTTAMHLRSEVKDGIARLREQLAPDEQTLLILRLDRQLSWKEVAQVMSDAGDPASEASLRKRFERVKDKLRELAIAEGLLPASRP